MTDTSPSYRIWQSPESVMIQAGGASIELSIPDALALVTDITALLVPRPAGGRIKWTPELVAETARLYRDEGLGSRRIAKRMGVSYGSIDHALRIAGVAKRPPPNQALVNARAAKRARRAAE